MPLKNYDAVLLASFGGPEGQDDVIPFLRNVTRGRGVPEERLEEVAHHYRAFGGISPINDQNRVLQAALQTELDARGFELPVLWGNRNWAPYLPEVLHGAYAAGHRRILVLTTSAYSCYSSCRQYREDLGMTLKETGLDGKLEVDKIRQYFDHPGFLAPFVTGVAEGVQRVQEQLEQPTEDTRGIQVLFSTHSIPTRDAAAAGASPEESREFAEGSAYVAQHLAAADYIMQQVDPQLPWSLVYQSRSGPPQVPWLEPDINDSLRELAAGQTRGVVVVPLGFISDHMEVAWDLDTEAKETAEELGLAFTRTPTPGIQADFVAGLADLIAERAALGELSESSVQPERLAMTDLGPWYDVCRAGCCENFRGEKPTIAGTDTRVGMAPRA